MPGRPLCENLSSSETIVSQRIHPIVNGKVTIDNTVIVYHTLCLTYCDYCSWKTCVWLQAWPIKANRPTPVQLVSHLDVLFHPTFSRTDHCLCHYQRSLIDCYCFGAITICGSDSAAHALVTFQSLFIHATKCIGRLISSTCDEGYIYYFTPTVIFSVAF